MADGFTFELVSPEKLLTSQEVASVVIPGTEGEMTIMAHHAPVMTSVKPGVVELTDTDGGSEKFVVFGGFADILPDRCTLLAESAVRVADIDQEELQQRIQNAREDVADAKDAEARAKAEEQLHHLETLGAAVFN